MNTFKPYFNSFIDLTKTQTQRTNVFDCKDDFVKVKLRRNNVSYGKSRKGKLHSNSNPSRTLTRKTRKAKKHKSKRKYGCLHLSNPKTKKQLQRLLNRKRVTTCVTAPNQRLANCWFNTMFMSFFISDKGFKFSKLLRQIMIHGERRDKSMIDKNMRMPFMRLNAAIQSSIDCNDERKYLLNNTNIIIEDIAKNLPQEDRIHTVFKPNEAGGPLEYYALIIHYLLRPLPHEHPVLLLRGYDFITLLTDPSSLSLFRFGNTAMEPPDIIVCEIRGEMMEDAGISGLKINKPLRFRLNKEYEYMMDSFILANDEHYISFHMIHGKQMGFDGVTRSRLKPFLWRNKINKDENFNLYRDKKSVKRWSFNFVKNQQFLIYFRVK